MASAVGSRARRLTGAQWVTMDLLLPSSTGRRGRSFGDDRRVIDGITFRFGTSTPWRDLPGEEFGPWQSAWKRHRRQAGDGTLDRVLQSLLGYADAAGLIDWDVCDFGEKRPDGWGLDALLSGLLRLGEELRWNCVEIDKLLSR